MSDEIQNPETIEARIPPKITESELQEIQGAMHRLQEAQTAFARTQEALNAASLEVHAAEAVRDYLLAKLSATYGMKAGDALAPDGTIIREVRENG